MKCAVMLYHSEDKIPMLKTFMIWPLPISSDPYLTALPTVNKANYLQLPKCALFSLPPPTCLAVSFHLECLFPLHLPSKFCPSFDFFGVTP